jgi:hypothetical protein
VWCTSSRRLRALLRKDPNGVSLDVFRSCGAQETRTVARDADRVDANRAAAECRAGRRTLPNHVPTMSCDTTSQKQSWSTARRCLRVLSAERQSNLRTIRCVGRSDRAISRRNVRRCASRRTRQDAMDGAERATEAWRTDAQYVRRNPADNRSTADRRGCCTNARHRGNVQALKCWAAGDCTFEVGRLSVHLLAQGTFFGAVARLAHGGLSTRRIPVRRLWLRQSAPGWRTRTAPHTDQVPIPSSGLRREQRRNAVPHMSPGDIRKRGRICASLRNLRTITLIRLTAAKCWKSILAEQVSAVADAGQRCPSLFRSAFTIVPAADSFSIEIRTRLGTYTGSGRAFGEG